MHASITIPLTILLTVILGSCDSTDGDATKSKGKRPTREHLVMAIPVERNEQVRSYERYGVVRARRIVHIHALEEGQIRELPWYEGDHVKEGELLVQLDDELVRADLMRVEAELDKAQQNLARLEKLEESKAISEEALITARTDVAVSASEKQQLETRVNYSRVLAPFSGVITERELEVGDFAAKNDHLLTIIDPGSLVVEISVSELLLPRIRLGDRAEIRIDALGDRRLQGEISRIHPTIDQATGQGTVEVMFRDAGDDTDLGAAPGQTARVLMTTTFPNQISIPYSSLQQDRDMLFVYLVDVDSKVEKRRIKAGIYGNDSVEVIEGLEDGDAVIYRGLLGLKEGLKVKVVSPEEG